MQKAQENKIYQQEEIPFNEIECPVCSNILEWKSYTRYNDKKDINEIYIEDTCCGKRFILKIETYSIEINEHR